MEQFNLDHASEARRASIASDLSKFYAEMAGAAPEKQERFSLTRLITRMSDGNLVDGKIAGYEGEVCRAAAMAQGRMWNDARTQIVPWGALMGRALVAGTPSAGGNLIGATPVNPLDVLRPFSVVARMGISKIENLAQDLFIPAVDTPTTAEWLANEYSAITPTSPVIGQTAFKPKTAGSIVKASLNFLQQSKFSDEVIRSQLLAAIGAAIDQAVLGGTGASGQPTGLSIAAGLNEQSGAVSFSNLLGALETLANAKADDENIKFITTPAVRKMLQARELAASTGRMLWSGNTLVDKPAFVTTDCPTGTIFAGDWSKVMLCLWGSGVEIIVDPYTNFKSGAVQVRALVSVDVAVTRPAAMLRHTSAS